MHYVTNESAGAGWLNIICFIINDSAQIVCMQPTKKFRQRDVNCPLALTSVMYDSVHDAVKTHD